jgi:hypothetical protein
MDWLSDPKIMVRVHGWATVAWIVLSVVTTGLALTFPENSVLLAWVIFMSGYANAASHWGARQAAEAGAEVEDTHA